MTLAQCEFNGKYYGGGVSELVPSEFKNITIPYREIAESDINRLEMMFQNDEPVEKIIQFVNDKTIGLDFSQKEIEALEEIRRKLVARRKVDR